MRQAPLDPYCKSLAVEIRPNEPNEEMHAGRSLLTRAANCPTHRLPTTEVIGIRTSAAGTFLAFAAGMINRRIRVAVFLATCAAGLAWSSLSLAAGPEPMRTCCSQQGDCGDSVKCCDYRDLGLDPCDEEGTGYCQQACPRAGLD